MTTYHLDAVDLGRYPIHDLDGDAGRALVARCRADLARLGACDLPGFLRPEVVRRIVQEIPDWGAETVRTENTHNVEFSGREDEFAGDDPLRIRVRSAKSLIAYDQIPGASPLRALYETDELTAFVGAALSVDPIYRQADEIGALNVMLYERGTSSAGTSTTPTSWSP